MVPPLPNSTSLLCGEVVWVDELDDGGEGVGLLLLFMFLECFVLLEFKVLMNMNTMIYVGDIGILLSVE